MRTTRQVKQRREEEKRAIRQAAIPMPAERQLVFDRPRKTFVAVSEYGYGAHEIAAAAIRLAQDEVPAKSKPRQLLLYEHLAGDMTLEGDLTPTGWKNGQPTWPNGTKVKLVGLTTTHDLFVQRPSI